MGTSGNCFRASGAVLGQDEDYWEQFKGKSGLVGLCQHSGKFDVFIMTFVYFHDCNHYK